ncbi:uroporphyrinogen-III C-methyltransferase [Rhodobacteraceae bacterium 2CG4]|uniref:Uroporphyrinogen-III C-methyltransferase n=2 Tax=Halovulum marinum TaxID=2662447 RepID=A0A6L5Z0K4_9RHOB|nr:uroporphyrinogen-III C-methyltransferase [Halovulum marinum]
MFIRTSGRRVVVAGGGEQAAQKARLILKTDADLVLAAPQLCRELRALVRSGRAAHHAGPVTPALFAGTALSFVATGCPGADASLHALAKAGGALVNVVDRPELCDATTPAIVDRDPVVVAIGTEGTAPVLARALKTRIEQMMSPRLGAWAAHAGALRDAVARGIPPAARRAFWSWVFHGRPAQLHRQGRSDEAAALLDSAIAGRRVPEGAGTGHVALVGAGPGARDLLTLRAVERLQEADVIFYDRLVGEDVLELARRDAERVHVGKQVGCCAWPQDRISAAVMAEARKGRRVVRLKSGDPSVFGRATEEVEAARAAGVPVEIVPGVTAATAAAATLQDSLTCRGDTDTIVLTTGMCRPGDPPPDWGAHVRPGATLVVYMGVGAADRIAASLIGGGAGPSTPVDIAVAVSTADERVIRARLGDLGATLRRENVAGVALIIVRIPKRHVAPAIAAE